jgi:hypothetical protein
LASTKSDKRRTQLFIGASCAAALFAIAVLDLLLPEVELLPLNAVPVLIGTRLLPGWVTATLAGAAIVAGLAIEGVRRGHPSTILIGTPHP